MTVCLKLEIVEGIFQNGNIAFCYDVKTQRAAAPLVLDPLLAHLSRRLRGELIENRSSRCPSVCASVCVFTLSNINISETYGSIATKFYLKHHWGWGLAA